MLSLKHSMLWKFQLVSMWCSQPVQWWSCFAHDYCTRKGNCSKPDKNKLALLQPKRKLRMNQKVHLSSWNWELHEGRYSWILNLTTPLVAVLLSQALHLLGVIVDLFCDLNWWSRLLHFCTFHLLVNSTTVVCLVCTCNTCFYLPHEWKHYLTLANRWRSEPQLNFDCQNSTFMHMDVC